MTGGTVDWHIICYGNSTANIAGGSINKYLFGFDNSVITVSVDRRYCSLYSSQQYNIPCRY